jgi:hypothetical protein
LISAIDPVENGISITKSTSKEKNKEKNKKYPKETIAGENKF